MSGVIREIVLRCRSCGQHQALAQVEQRCDCAVSWRGWAIAHIAKAEAPVPEIREQAKDNHAA